MRGARTSCLPQAWVRRSTLRQLTEMNSAEIVDKVHHQTRMHTTNYVCYCEHCGHDHWIDDDCPVQHDYPER